MQFSNRHLPITMTLIAVSLLYAPFGKAGVVYIDKLTNAQTVFASNAVTTNTIAAGGAVGGFRTMVLSATNNDTPEFDSRFRVATNTIGPRLELTSQTGAAAAFQVVWGGLGGTNGLGGIDFRDGIAATNFSLIKSALNFSLLASDSVNNITWSFTDTNNVTASYATNLPVNASPAIAYALRLADFSNAGIINWSAINFISLSGLGATSLDLTLSAPFSVTANPIPEPGTWAAAGLLLLTAGYIRWRRSRSAGTQEEAPAAA